MQANQASSTSAVVLVPSEPPKSNRYSDMKCVPSLRAFSSISIILGIISIALQIAALCTNVPWYSFDPVGHGIWAGAFYVIAGSLGLASASKKTRALIITTVVFASLSIASAIVASTLSGLSAAYSSCYNYYNYNCNAWYSLEWTLMGFSIGAIFNSITLTVFASIALGKGRPKAVQPVALHAGFPQAVYAQPMAPTMHYPNQGFAPTHPGMQYAQPIFYPMVPGPVAQANLAQQTGQSSNQINQQTLQQQQASQVTPMAPEQVNN